MSNLAKNDQYAKSIINIIDNLHSTINDEKTTIKEGSEDNGFFPVIENKPNQIMWNGTFREVRTNSKDGLGYFYPLGTPKDEIPNKGFKEMRITPIAVMQLSDNYYYWEMKEGQKKKYPLCELLFVDLSSMLPKRIVLKGNQLSNFLNFIEHCSVNIWGKNGLGSLPPENFVYPVERKDVLSINSMLVNHSVTMKMVKAGNDFGTFTLSFEVGEKLDNSLLASLLSFYIELRTSQTDLENNIHFINHFSLKAMGE